MRGCWFIAESLIKDIAALKKMEMLQWTGVLSSAGTRSGERRTTTRIAPDLRNGGRIARFYPSQCWQKSEVTLTERRR
jgi:hypothetical protein